MIEINEIPEDVESLLKAAEAELHAFEDGVDRKRLLERLRTQSPMHPVLLFRSVSMGLAIFSGLAALIVMIVPLISQDLARSLVKFEAVVPAPPGIPGLPALLGVLMACMLVSWLMATLAAQSMGRDAQMLTWEQKQHQKLVNEVTRLTTQKAVMERIRGTPAGARPRIATPVPMSGRGRRGMATPAGAVAHYDYAAPSGPGSSSSGGSPLGGVPGRFGPAPGATPGPSSRSGLAGGAPGNSSVLGRARSSGLQDPIGGSGSAPASSAAGRLGFGAPPPSDSGPSGYQERSPLGAAPRAGRGLGTSGSAPSPRGQRLAAPLGFPGTPDPAPRTMGPPHTSPARGGLFGTPPPASPHRTNGTKPRGLLGRDQQGYPSDDLDLSGPGPHSARAPLAPVSAERLNEQTFPRWGRIDQPWLEEAVQRAERVAASFPEQAHLQFSQEAHLPFTLVIARATPAMAVRAMVAYVEFLASILTPPRGRIELQNVPHLDSSFHRNVSAALEPYFGDRFEVEPEIGRVEIIFKDPDPGWQDFPVLPME